MSKIFISYRRHDSPGFAGRICDHVNLHFGNEAVFRDVETLEGGVDFVEAINSAVGSCAAFILVIGPRWLSAVDAKGNRRLDNHDDFVRMELATALARQIRVIPVLVEGADMPSAADLPDDIKAVTRRQAIEISDARFASDMDELTRALKSVLGQPKPTPPGIPSPVSAFVPPSHPSNPPPHRPFAAVAVPNHLVWSIISTACLCMPLGIVAIVQSNKCTSALAAGDVSAAQSAAANAKKWNLIALAAAGVVWFIYIVAAAINAAQQH